MKKLILAAAVAALLAGSAFTGRSHGKTIPAGADTLVVNTTELGKDVKGYAGATPVEIRIVNNKIVEIKALPNQESPGFLQRVFDSGLLKKLNGKTVAEAKETKLDAVAGATFSSNAFIENIKLGLESVKK